MILSFLPYHLFATEKGIVRNDLKVEGLESQTTTSNVIGIDRASKFSGDGYEVEAKVNNQWNGAFNGEFILKNTSNE